MPPHVVAEVHRLLRLEARRRLAERLDREAAGAVAAVQPRHAARAEAVNMPKAVPKAPWTSQARIDELIKLLRNWEARNVYVRKIQAHARPSQVRTS